MLAYAPTTDRGTGISLPLVKTIGHLMAPFTALARDWPMTVEQARAELTEARDHLDDVTYPADLLTADTDMAIAELRETLREQLNALTATEHATPEQALADYATKDDLKHLVESAWTLAATLDTELTGQPADPGRLP